MSPRLEHFLKEKRILLAADWAELNNWNEETTKASLLVVKFQSSLV